MSVGALAAGVWFDVVAVHGVAFVVAVWRLLAAAVVLVVVLEAAVRRSVVHVVASCQAVERLLTTSGWLVTGLADC